MRYFRNEHPRVILMMRNIVTRIRYDFTPHRASYVTGFYNKWTEIKMVIYENQWTSWPVSAIIGIPFAVGKRNKSVIRGNARRIPAMREDSAETVASRYNKQVTIPQQMRSVLPQTFFITLLKQYALRNNALFTNYSSVILTVRCLANNGITNYLFGAINDVSEI